LASLQNQPVTYTPAPCEHHQGLPCSLDSNLDSATSQNQPVTDNPASCEHHEGLPCSLDSNLDLVNSQNQPDTDTPASCEHHQGLPCSLDGNLDLASSQNQPVTDTLASSEHHQGNIISSSPAFYKTYGHFFLHERFIMTEHQKDDSTVAAAHSKIHGPCRECNDEIVGMLFKCYECVEHHICGHCVISGKHRQHIIIRPIDFSYVRCGILSKLFCL